MKRWKFAGINFDHLHMGDLLRRVREHPGAELVAICDETPARMAAAAQEFALPPERVFTDYRACLETSRPDVVILCPATAAHGEWTEKVAPYGPHILVEKPFAASLAEADRMTRAVAQTGRLLAINWPMVWQPAYRTLKRVADEGLIGDVCEVHYYHGNRGPRYAIAEAYPAADAPTLEGLARWFYQKDAGGGSLLDYLGYGATLGTWYLGGRKPLEVMTMVDEPEALEVDEHSITLARYPSGLSKFETRWGTFTDPWTHQPQPKCGFVLVGAAGNASGYSHESTVRVQTAQAPEGRELPVDPPAAPHRNPIEYLITCLEQGEPLSGPLSPAISRIGQQIVDSAVRSAQQKRAVALIE